MFQQLLCIAEVNIFIQLQILSLTLQLKQQAQVFDIFAKVLAFTVLLQILHQVLYDGHRVFVQLGLKLRILIGNHEQLVA